MNAAPNLCSPPANRCFSPTRASRTSPSGARDANPSAAIRRITRGTINEPKLARRVRSAGRKPRFPSSPRKDGRFTAGNASSRDGPWAHRLDPPGAVPYAGWRLNFCEGTAAPSPAAAGRSKTRVTAAPRRDARRQCDGVFSSIHSCTKVTRHDKSRHFSAEKFVSLDFAVAEFRTQGAPYANGKAEASLRTPSGAVRCGGA